MKYNYLSVVPLGALAVALLNPALAFADSAKDAQVAARALAFMENGPTGGVVMGVVFDPAKPGSVAEKNAIMAALGGGYNAGTVTIAPKAVEADSAADAGLKVLFLTHGVGYGAVGGAAKAKHIITIGSDPACVASGACVMGVTTEPAVQITVNHNAAAAVGATFKAAFRMLIREI